MDKFKILNDINFNISDAKADIFYIESVIDPGPPESIKIYLTTCEYNLNIFKKNGEYDFIEKIRQLDSVYLMTGYGSTNKILQKIKQLDLGSRLDKEDYFLGKIELFLDWYINYNDTIFDWKKLD